MTAVLSAATLIVVLWTIGGALTVQLGGMPLTIPGYLVVAGTLRPIKVASESLRCRPNSPTQFETRKKLLKC